MAGSTVDFVRKEISASIEVKQRLLADASVIGEVAAAIEFIEAAYKKGNKLLIAGNGGSAADAQHIAAEFVSRFNFDRPALPALALTTDTSILTAIGNDYGYDRLFARQLEGNGNKGDVFLAISTSGNSANILMAIESAKQREINVIGLCGETGGKMAPLCDFAIRIPSHHTPRIQECHIVVGHIICDALERSMFPDGPISVS